jgi:amidase
MTDTVLDPLTTPQEGRRVVLEARDLRSGYGSVPVLHGVSLRLEEGQALGIVGHNGMGKSTLIKTLVGLLPATAGSIKIDGVDVTREPAHARSRRGLAYVPQGRGILPALSAVENLRLAWTGDSSESEQEAIDRVVALFPRLAPLLERRGGQLSGGEQQLLAIARALISNPWVVLLDEPSEGVQPSLIQEIGQTLSRLRTQAALSLVIVEQNLDLVLDVATRIAVMERGRIERELDPRETGAGGALVQALGMGSVRLSRTNSSPGFAAKPGNLHSLKAPPMNAPLPAMASVKRPSLAQMREIASSLHLSMSEAEIAEYLQVLEPTFQAYDRVQQLPDNLPPVKYPRTPAAGTASATSRRAAASCPD